MSEFNQHAESYGSDIDHSLGRLQHDVFIASKIWHLQQLFRRWNISANSKVLDLGCGVGTFDAGLEALCDLHGCDPSSESIRIASEHNAHTRYAVTDDEKLPYPDNHFDLIFTINVMHHVPPEQWDRFLREAHSKLKPGAPLCIFEHNPLNPLTRRVVDRCAFDQDAVLLTRSEARSLLRQANYQIESSGYIVFFPINSPLFFSLETFLHWLPLGAQYLQCGSKITE
ncbi:MAG: class I SAM-dependent methyltransferase [Gammaproteobacteria bacterium]|nr:class I SAM-dependent methyltransferase [Gammaproteobacteria bacterium]